jgi:septal ring factor EnvC (AmiA/AmiB activator)
MDEASEILRLMKMKARDLSRDQKQTVFAYVAEQKRSLDSLKKQSLTSGGAEAKADPHDRAAMNTERLNSSTARLEAAMKTVNETADVGEGILSELDRQKDVIAHTHENVRKVNDDLKTSNTMLNKMGKWWRKL